MTLWTCEACGRRFGRTGQSHECAPALSLEEYFATGPARERPIFDAVNAVVAPLGAVHVEPVSVGIFFKRSRTFAQLRPMTRWVALSFVLARKLESPRLARKVMGEGRRWYHAVNLTGPEDVDEQVRAWLTEAYLADAP